MTTTYISYWIDTQKGGEQGENQTTDLVAYVIDDGTDLDDNADEEPEA